MKMKTIFYFLLVFGLMVIIEASEKEKEFSLNFQQHDYQLKFERSELVRFNKHYIRDVSLKTYKYNRTTPVVNITGTFNVDIGYDLEVIVQAYRFASNEYRFFPLHFGANFCKALAADVGGFTRVFNCGNFTGCPIAKGRTFHVCNFYPDQSKLPPYIPNGDYKIEFQGLHSSTEIVFGNLFASVTRSIFAK